jgi:hypothetical protein
LNCARVGFGIPNAFVPYYDESLGDAFPPYDNTPDAVKSVFDRVISDKIGCKLIYATTEFVTGIIALKGFTDATHRFGNIVFHITDAYHKC